MEREKIKCLKKRNNDFSLMIMNLMPNMAMMMYMPMMAMMMRD